jgi:hypothetical protein
LIHIEVNEQEFISKGMKITSTIAHCRYAHFLGRHPEPPGSIDQPKLWRSSADPTNRMPVLAKKAVKRAGLEKNSQIFISGYRPGKRPMPWKYREM